MPPTLALFLAWCLIGWLLRTEFRFRKLRSKALWVPAILISVQGSRPVSEWLGSVGQNRLAGDPVNTLTFAVLIGVSLIVLRRRNFNWNLVVNENKALFLIYAYLAASALWSDVPLVSLKRLLKDYACVLAALVFLTEQDPASAVRAVYVRVAYILFPLSLVYGKYFPSIGRNYSQEGEPMFTGVTTQKNSLGELVFILALFLVWDLVETWRDTSRKKLQRAVRVLIIFLGLWLLIASDSKTSIFCLIVGVAIFWAAGRLLRMKHGKQLLISSLAVIICLAALDETFGLSQMIIRALGRNPTLTGRTEIWRVLLDQHTNPLVGEGFYIFWDTEKGNNAANALARINTAHNGYLEMYLDGGIIGIALLVFLLLNAGKRAIGRLFNHQQFGKMALIFWALAIIYNWSESSFFRLDLLWFTFLLVTINYPLKRSAARRHEVQVGASIREPQWA